jgi:hypothetical protein
MVNLWYSDDEDEEFHPVVRDSVQDAISNLELGGQLSLEHKPNLNNSQREPDFVLYENGRPVLVIEVKKTKSQCKSERYWSQARDYVNLLSSRWSDRPPYFLVTNIETLYLLKNRQGQQAPTYSCLLEDNPYVNSEFESPEIENNADVAVEEFTSEMENIIDIITKGRELNWVNTWQLLVDSFRNNFDAIKSEIDLENELVERDVSSFELVRILAYGYLREVSRVHNFDYSDAFQNLPENQSSPRRFVNKLLDVYEDVLEIDFKQVFENHPDEDNRILPNNTSEENLEHIESFVQKVNYNMGKAVAENDSAGYFLDLIKDESYDWEELHKEGKASTDSELALVLAKLTIDSEEQNIIDIGTGLGSLSDAAYDRLEELYRSSSSEYSHNKLISQLNGVEQDAFLNQLATFRLLTKDPEEVTEETEINFVSSDAFEEPQPEKYDVILMNPPYLRNDNKVVPITQEKKTHMLESIEEVKGEESWVRKANQPNLYFYFVDWAKHYLKSEGKSGIILYRKFLKNQNAQYVREFLKDDLIATVTYPRGFFNQFKTTTCIALAEKDSDRDTAKFIRISDKKLLEEPDKIRKLVYNDETDFGGYEITEIEKSNLQSKENWSKYLVDVKKSRKYLENSPITVRLDEIFEDSIRGRAGNRGGSNAIFPDTEEFNVEEQFIGGGMKKSNFDRNYILKDEDLEIEPAIKPPAKYENSADSGLEEQFTGYEGLKSFYDYFQKDLGDTWKGAVNDAYNSKEDNFDLAVPRNLRAKHAVYCNPRVLQSVISTNFFKLKGLKVDDEDHNEGLKCLCGYLMSSFGQLSFEINSGNQEGTRKLESEDIRSIQAIDVRELDSEQTEKIASAFEEFNDNGTKVRGDERESPRDELDQTVAEILFEKYENGFDSSKELKDEFQGSVRNLVQERNPDKS